MQIAFTVDLHRGNSRSSDVTSHCERGSRQLNHFASIRAYFAPIILTSLSDLHPQFWPISDLRYHKRSNVSWDVANIIIIHCLLLCIMLDLSTSPEMTCQECVCGIVHLWVMFLNKMFTSAVVQCFAQDWKRARCCLREKGTLARGFHFEGTLARGISFWGQFRARNY